MRKTLTLPKRVPARRSQLILTRRSGQSLEIGDSTVTVHINRGEATVVIQAPLKTHIRRSELAPREAV